MKTPAAAVFSTSALALAMALGCADDTITSSSELSLGSISDDGLNTLVIDDELVDVLAEDDGLYYDVVVVFDAQDQVDGIHALGRSAKTYEHLPFARAVLSRDDIAELSSWPEVRFIEPNRELELLNAEGRELTGAEDVQEVLGLDGTGVEVAVIDTGADGAHPDLVDRLRYNWQVVGDLFGPLGYVSSTPDGIDVETVVVDASYEDGEPVNNDEYGHGTHVLGTIGGSGAASEGHYRGMAPGAVMDSYSASAGIFLVFVIDAYEHILAQNGSGEADIRIVSNSWGTDGCQFDPEQSVNVMTRVAYEQGILSVFAYGNEGPSADTCNPYTTAPYVLGVAATDKTKKITGFSSRGIPGANHDRELALANFEEYVASPPEVRDDWDQGARPLGVFRPGIAAPGQDIVSAQNPLHPMTLSGTDYGSASGTSMATPMVSGIAALATQAYAQASGSAPSPLELIRLLEVTGDVDAMRGYNAHEAGAGFVDALAATERALAGDIPSAVTEEHLVHFDPGELRAEIEAISGTVLVDSWETDEGYELHEIDVNDGAISIEAEVSWALEAERVYLRLYAPGLDPVEDEATVVSAALLTVANSRSISFPFPEAGTWTLRVDGRVNLVATSYEGETRAYYADNAAPTASVSATPERVQGSEPVSISAEIRDPNGLEDLAEAGVVVRDRNGRVRARFSPDDMAAADDETLVLDAEVELTGPAPWVVQASAADSDGQVAFDEAFVGRK